MADIAVLSCILEKLACLLLNGGQFLKNKAELLQAISDELRSVSDELQRMKASLRAADTAEANDDHQVRAWVGQLRDTIYDTEDAIAQMKRLPNPPGNLALLRKFCCMVHTLESRHSADLPQIKDRITKIFDWQSNNRERIDRIEQGSSSNSTGGDALVVDITSLVGIDGPKQQLINWLTEDNTKRKVISVVGKGGSGKTTLVKQVYDAVQGYNQFEVQVWVTISQPLTKSELLRYIVQQLLSAIEEPVPPGFDRMSDEQLRVLIKSSLTRPYLIVLDDVWHVKYWHALNHALANRGNNSRVILTTQKTNIACTCCGEPGDQIFNLEPLSEQDSWDLFCRITFKGSGCPDYLTAISKRTLERCEGLPLAIEAISKLLASKVSTINFVEQWERILSCMGDKINSTDGELNSLKEVLLRSFHDLSDNLKYCFMYLGIFPENHIIEKMRLVRMWKAEGFVEVKDGLTPEEAAEEHLEELLNRGLIQVVTRTSGGKVKTCKISHVWREMIISLSRDWNFVTVAKKEDAASSSQITRRLSIHTTLNNECGKFDVSRIRSLFMFEVEDHLSGAALRHLLLEGYRVLRVLDLRGTNLEVFPDEIVKLKLLIYLSLRGTKIQTIPGSIEQLQDLETVDLKQSYVTEMPVQTRKLKNLRHLLVYRYEFKHNHRFKSKHGLKALPGIGDLRFLQKLCSIGADNEQLIEELGKLTQLKRLGILNLKENYGPLLCSSINKLPNLQALSVVSTSENEVIDLESLSSPPPLQRLDLIGKLKKIPVWVSSLYSLAKIRLKWSQIDHIPFDSLQSLPNLSHLELLKLCQGATLSFKAAGFQKLKILVMDEFEQLKSIEVENGAMPRLEEMSIFRCKLLENVPSGIEHLSTLKRLDLFEVSEDLMNSLPPGVQAGNNWKVASIPDVYYTYLRNGGWEVHHLGSSGKRVLDVPETDDYKTYLEGIWSK